MTGPARGEAWVEDGETQDGETKRVTLDDAYNAKKEEQCAVQRSFNDFPHDAYVELNDAPLSISDHNSGAMRAPSFRPNERAHPQQTFVFFPAHESSSSPQASVCSASRPPNLSRQTSSLRRTTTQTSSPTFNPTSPPTNATSWKMPDYAHPLGKVFDIILAADVVYHIDHAMWIRRCMERLLAHDGVLWLMLTTGRHEGLASTADKVFAEADEGLVIRSRKEYQRKGGVGRAGEGEHQLCILDNRTSSVVSQYKWYEFNLHGLGIDVRHLNTQQLRFPQKLPR